MWICVVELTNTNGIVVELSLVDLVEIWKIPLKFVDRNCIEMNGSHDPRYEHVWCVYYKEWKMHLFMTGVFTNISSFLYYIVYLSMFHKWPERITAHMQWMYVYIFEPTQAYLMLSSSIFDLSFEFDSVPYPAALFYFQ